MGSVVLHTDLEMFLVGWFRAKLAARPEEYCQNVVVDRVEPSPPRAFPERLLVVRSDGGTRMSVVSDEASVGLSVLAGTKLLPKDAVDLAKMVRALCEMLPAVEPGNPVAALVNATGPVAVDEAQDRSRQYITLDLAVAGLPL